MRRLYIGWRVRILQEACQPPCEWQGCWRAPCMVRLFGAVEKGLMLFNSYPFIFLFLPIALLGYFALGRRGNLAPVIWLALASLAFYALSSWQFVPLLLASIAFNYLIGYLLIARKLRATAAVCGADGRRRRRSPAARHLQICRFLRRQFQCAAFDRLRGRTSCCRSASPSTPSPRSRSWSMPTAAMSRAMRCRITRCSSPISRI